MQTLTMSPEFDANPALYSSIRTKRFFAFCVDTCLIFLVASLLFVINLFLTVVTFGVAWIFMAFVFPAAGLAYNALTLGGEMNATPGMRLVGLEMSHLNGSSVSPLMAAGHILLFWVITGPAITWVLLIGPSFFSNKKRLLHDILLGVVVYNRDERFADVAP